VATFYTTVQGKRTKYLTKTEPVALMRIVVINGRTEAPNRHKLVLLRCRAKAINLLGCECERRHQWARDVCRPSLSLPCADAAARMLTMTTDGCWTRCQPLVRDRRGVGLIILDLWRNTRQVRGGNCI